MKKALLYLMCLFYVLAGTSHFLFTEKYASIMPDWVPWHNTVVIVSGVLEILYGVLLLFKITRKLASMLIISLLIAVFPANVQMCIDYFLDQNPYFIFTLLRLPLQVVLIYWAYLYAKENDYSKGR